MIRLHEIAPDYFPEEKEVDALDQIYKQHHGESHEAALEAVFIAGVQCVISILKQNAKQTDTRFSVNDQIMQCGPNMEDGLELQKLLNAQAMGMGKTFLRKY